MKTEENQVGVEDRALEDAQHAKELLGRLYVLTKNARSHDRHNEAMLAAARAAHALLMHMLEESDSVRFDIVNDSVFYNNMKLRADLTTFGIFKYVIRESRRRGFQAVVFNDAAEIEDVVGFAVAFAHFNQACLEPFKEMKRLLQMEGVTGIYVLPVGAEGDPLGQNDSAPADTREAAKRAFFSAFHIVKETVRGGISKGAINPRKIKRVMETVVDSVLRDEESMFALTHIRDYDAYTYYHSINVCLLSIAIGTRLGLPKPVLCEIGIGALFHDIGKTEVPHSILNKPAELTREEWQCMQKHTEHGVCILTELKKLDRAIVRAMVVAFCHHMNINQSGYPRTDRHVRPDVFSRIVRIADIFDALTTARCYKIKPFSSDEALEIIREKAGTELDPILSEMVRDVAGAITGQVSDLAAPAAPEEAVPAGIVAE
jgi:HD-GYP domain-containing protein (c-di-GMP phosphodiesterase class II)